MSKIRNLKEVKERLEIGEIECSYVWSLDGQVKLKGNPLRAFERSLRMICNFEKTKKGRKTYYIIKEIYREDLEREHNNKSALKGNLNRKGKIGFKKNSNVEFVAAVLVNKIEYFECNYDKGYRTVSQWINACGLSSSNERVNERIRGMMNRAIEKLIKLQVIGGKVEYKACIDDEYIIISQKEYERYTEKSRKCLMEVLGEKLYKKYKCYYMFDLYYKHSDKEELKKKYWEIMNEKIQFVYKTYRLYDNLGINKDKNQIYNRLLDVIFGEESEELFISGETIKDKVQAFVKDLEESIEFKTIEMKIGF